MGEKRSVVEPPLTETEVDLWGSSNEWSMAITGASAQLLGLPGYGRQQRDGAERIARAYLAEIGRGRPTTRVLYSGHALSQARLDELQAQRIVRLPLTALSADESFARGFTTGQGLAVLMRFDKGTRALRYSDIEWITAGTFLVKTVRHGRDPYWKTPLVTATLTQLSV